MITGGLSRTILCLGLTVCASSEAGQGPTQPGLFRGEDGARLEALLGQRPRVKEDPRQALAAAEEALVLARKADALRLKALLFVGEARLASEDSKGAVGALEEAEALSRRLGDERCRGDSLLLLATALRRMAQYPAALERASDALPLLEKFGERGKVLDCLNLIGLTHLEAGQAPQARAVWERALAMAVQDRNLVLQGKLQNNLAILEKKEGHLATALRRLEEAYRIFKQLGVELEQVRILSNLLSLRCAMGNPAGAEREFLKALEYYETKGDPYWVVMMLNNYAEFCLESKKTNQGRPYLTRGRELAERVGNPEQVFSLYGLEVRYAEAAGDLGHALAWQRRLQEQKDAFFRRDLASKLAEANGRFEVERRQRELDLVRKEMANRRWGYGSLALAMLGLLAFLVYRNRTKAKNEEALTAKNLELERLNQQKTEFLGIVAHDLRNPLTGMTLIAQSLIGDSDLGRIWTDAEVLVSEGRAMNQLLERYLCLSAIEAGELLPKPERLPLGVILGEVQALNQPQARAKRIHLELIGGAESAWVEADPGFLRQVVDNLLSNALKFTPKAGRVRVRLVPGETEHRLEVEDQGPGIPLEDRPRLFDRFSRLGAKPTGKESSIGLGLSIVKHMVDACGGRVWVEDAPEAGTVFSVALPAAPPGS